MPYYPLLVGGIYLTFAVAELAVGRFFQGNARRDDSVVDAVSFGFAPAFIVPAVFITVSASLGRLWPESADLLAELPWWTMVALFLIFDDLPQYAWHRLSHRIPALYALHRTHHEAQYMSVRLVYRNNLLYYAAMPGLWTSAVLVHLGGGAVYAIYAVIKILVIAGAHSSLPWDAPLHRNRALHPLAWVLERLISTPATHSAHHGFSDSDGVTHYNGNFGNLLFIWDVIFGTARITRRRPERFGIHHLPPANWTHQLFYPFLPAPKTPD